MGDLREKQSATKNKKIAADSQIFPLCIFWQILESAIALAIISAKIILFLNQRICG